MSCNLALSPSGHLFVEPDAQAEPKLSQTAAAQLTEGFAVSSARGLEMLASEFLHEPGPPPFVFWRGLAQRVFTAVCHQPEPEQAITVWHSYFRSRVLGAGRIGATDEGLGVSQWEGPGKVVD